MIKEEINGITLNFSVTFKQLYNLSTVDIESYRDFFEIYSQSEKSLADKAILIYVAYLCAISDSSRLDEETFFELLDNNLLLVEKIYRQLFFRKNNFEFYDAFYRRTKSKIKFPKYKLNDVEDYFSLYVLEMGIPEHTFWNCDISFVENIAKNKSAIDSFIAREKEKK